MVLEDIRLSEISQTEKDKYYMIRRISLICEILKTKPKNKLIDTENRLVIPGGGRWRVGEIGGKSGQKVQNSSHKINKSWDECTEWQLQLIILYCIFESC